MLVLARKKGETLYIGDDIKIMITDIRGDTVRIGVQAPKQIPVHRSEVWHQIQRHKDKDVSNSHDRESGPRTAHFTHDQTPPRGETTCDHWHGRPYG